MTTQDGKAIVADAKWKILTKKGLYGLGHSDFWQMATYMNLIKDHEIKGYFIVPKIDDKLEDEIEFKSYIEEKENIKILSIDFTLDFKDIINNYKFVLEDDNTLSFKKKFDRMKVLNKLESEFRKLVNNHNQNKRNYIRGITLNDFQEEYEIITSLLSSISEEPFKHDKKNFIMDFAKLSQTKITKLFLELKNDSEEDTINVGTIFKYTASVPTTKLYKYKNKSANTQKNWKQRNSQKEMVTN